MIVGAEVVAGWDEFLESRSETAFAEVVRRHIDLVYSVALRRCGGDVALAQDVAQIVFSDLSRKAVTLPRNLVLAGWLYRHSGFVASTLIRTEARRRRRELTAMEIHNSDDGVDWSQIAPALEDAMNELSERDRNAIVLRYFDQQPFAEVGSSLGIGSDAARMRIERALDRLRQHLSRRGITSTTAALALGISQYAVVAAPAGLAANVAASATLTGVTCAPPILFGLMTSTKISLGLAALVAVGATTAAYLEHRSNEALHAELIAVRADLAGRAAVAEQSEIPNATELEGLRQDRLRLMALRDEVGRLKEAERRVLKLEGENEALRKGREASNEPVEEKPRDFEAEMFQGLALARMNFAKSWMFAFHQFAAEHDDKLPGTFEEAAGYLTKDAGGVSILDPNRFEIMYQGSLKDISNPAAMIIIREREAFMHTSESTGMPVAMRTYAFADGHSEIHSAPDGDFDGWERSHLMPSSQR